MELIGATGTAEKDNDNPIITFTKGKTTVKLFATVDQTNLIDCFTIVIGKKKTCIIVERNDFNSAWKKVYNKIKPYL